MKTSVRKLLCTLLILIASLGWVNCANAYSKSDIQAKLIAALYGGAGGSVTCDFDGYVSTSGRHEGIDISCQNGAAVYAVCSGVVNRVANGYEGSGGLSTIAIYYQPLNKTVIYLHTAPLAGLSAGQSIAKGQQIATQSWRGVSSASGGHTHVEVVNGNASYAKVSVNDWTLENDDPYPFWESVLGGGVVPDPTVIPDNNRMVFVLDTIETVGQQLHLAGWVYDKQNPNAQVTLHVYPGEGVQGFATEGHRPDVNAAYSIDGLHGFDVYIQTNLVGQHEVSLYALHTDGSGAALMYQGVVKYTLGSGTVTPPPTTPPPVTPAPITDPTVPFQGNEKTIYDYLTGTIRMNPAAACGVLANIEKESSFNPTVYGDGETSYGICQWHDDRFTNRFTNLRNYCSQHGYDYTTLTGQLHFLQYELEGGYQYILDAMRAVDNSGDGAYEAGRVWCIEFERPDNSASLSVTRGNLAREKFNSIPNPVPVEDVRMVYVLDTVETVGQRLHLVGWVYDKQNPNAQVTLHVYPGEGVQGFATEGHRPDVNAAYNIDGLHGFDVYIPMSLVGSHEVSLYALHTDGSGAVLMYKSMVTYTADPIPDRTIADGRYVILSSASDSVELDVAGDTGDIPDGQNVQIWNTTALSQYNSFDITYLSSGYYKIIHAASQKSLDLYYANQENGANIVVHSYNGSDAQLWSITQEGYNGGYVIKSKSSGKVLDIDAGNTANGTNVQQWELLSTPGQTWRFVPAEYTVSYDANGGTGEPENQTKYYRNALTLSSDVPVRPGYTFLGWSVSKTAKTADYEAGSTFILDNNITLYAVWEADAPTSYIILPDGLKTIEEQAFEGTGVVYAVLPEGAESIGSKAFANCASLKHIYIPESVSSIAKDAFSGVPSGMVIHGVDGSYAEFFANKYEFEFVAE